MRRFTIFVLAIAVTLTAGAMGKGNQLTMKAVKSKMEFTEISVGPAIKLIIEERTEGNIIIRANERIMPDIKFEIEGDELSISYKRDMDFKDVPTVEVYMPYNGKIKELTAAACSIIDIRPTIKAKELRVNVIGASQVELSAVVDCAEFDIAGASNLVAQIECTKLECEVAGAAKATISGQATDAEFEIIGASMVKAEKFKVSQLDAEVSGASKATLNADMANLEVAGASSADIECTTSLDADVAGTSTVRYSGECRVNVIRNSGASTIKRR